MTIQELQTIHFSQSINPSRCWRAAISPDGKRAAASTCYFLDVRDVGSDELRWSLTFTDKYIMPGALAWSPDGSLLAVSLNNVVQLHDAATGRIVRSLNVPEKSSQITWTADGTRLLLTHRFIFIVDAMTGAELGKLVGPKFFARIALTADEKRVVAVGDKSLWVFDLATGEQLHRYPYERLGAPCLAIPADGSSAWVAQTGDTATRLQIGKKTKRVLATIEPSSNFSLGTIASTPDGQRFLLATDDGISLHSFDDGKTLAQHTAEQGWACDDLSISADGKRFITPNLDASATVWEIR
jgi:WD40 repeat protein